MLKRVKKLALTMIAAGILCGGVAMLANAETTKIAIPEDCFASGVVDEDYGQITWYIDADYKLVVSGTGDVKDPDDSSWDEYKEIPWYNYRNKIGTAEIDVKGMTNLSYFFYDCSLLENINFKNFDTSNVTDMSGMFENCSSLESLDVSGWDTSNVTYMGGMFDRCSLESLDLSGWDTSNVKSMGSMFNWCGSLESLDLSGWDTSNVTGMSYMFQGCSSLESLDLSGWDTSNVTGMVRMFSSCSSLESLDLSGWDTSNVTDMSWMFSSCSSLESLDLSGWDTSNVKSMDAMFAFIYSLKKIKTPKRSGLVTCDLPGGSWFLSDGTEIDELPTKSKESVVLTRELPGAPTPQPTATEAPIPTVTEMPEPTVTQIPEATATEAPIPTVTEMPEPTVTQIPEATETEIPKPTVPITSVFSDVHKDWYTDYVKYVYDEGLMTGIKGTSKFQPNANITKAQVAQVLYNMADQPKVTDKKVFKNLKDVYESEWYADAVAWAYNNNIVTGDINAKKFFPNADVTREQLAIMMYRFAKYKGMATSASSNLTGLKNAENVSNWAVDGVKWAVGSGLISGIEKNGVKDLAPQGNATRAQMAAILQRFCEKADSM